MKVLLDTHVFLWFISGDSRVPTKILAVVRDMDNEVFLSVVSFWEIVIKHDLGKLPLPESPDTYVPRKRELHGIDCLGVDEASVARLAYLPKLHRDPFDRLLVCQALEHDLTIATIDDTVRKYPAQFVEIS
jgi:PIN domain nuclease of toxin-antitoxin system